MIDTLAAVSFMSVSAVLKALCAALIVMLWARWASIVDKDTSFFNIPRRLWNAINVVAFVLAFVLIVFIPLFIIGFVLAVLIIGGTVWTYVTIRNKKVPEHDRWTFDKEMWRKALGGDKEAKAARRASIRFTKPPQGLRAVPLPEEPQYEAHLLFEQTIEPALQRGAQRLDMAGSDSQFVAQLSIDGVDYKQGQLPAPGAIAMIDYLKSQCGMDVSDRRRKQTGECRIDTEALGTFNLRVKTAGSTRGLTCTVLVNPGKQLTIPFKELGLLDNQLELLEPVIEETAGAVLIASPAGQGRTTTMYSIVGQHDPYTMDVHFLDREQERELESVTFHTVDSTSILKVLNSLLLRDPHVIAVGSVTDPQVAQVIAEAAAGGRRFYAGLRADDTFGALRLWLKAVGDANTVAKGLRMIVAQRLVRKLCEYCRQRYKPDAAVLRKLNLPADRIQQLYKAGGKIVVKNKEEVCPACTGLGYRGRVGAFELMPIDDEARQFIRAQKLDQLRAHLRRQKIRLLQETALAKVVSGVTSISEVTRALGQSQEQE